MSRTDGNGCYRVRWGVAATVVFQITVIIIRWACVHRSEEIELRLLARHQPPSRLEGG
jgi:hypothetical protein